MSSKMNLFLINTPFQLLCAIEAKKAYNLQNNILAVTKQAHNKSQSQLDSLIQDDEWDHIINLPGVQKAFTIPYFIYSLKKFSPNLFFDNIIFPDYLCWRANLILKNTKSNRQIMIDDGAMTIGQYETYLRDHVSFSKGKGFKDVIIKLFKLEPVHNIEFRDSFELFSIFSFPEESFIKQRNNLLVLQEKISSYQIYNKNSNAAFIGQGYIGPTLGVNIEDYIETILRYHSKVKRNIIYFPHRSESEEVKEHVSKLEFIVYHDSYWPVELEIYQKKIQLSSIAGVLSTALYSMSILYPDMPIYNITTNSKYYRKKNVASNASKITKYYKNNRIIEL